MAELHLYDDIYIDTDDIKSIEFKKDKKYFVTKDSYDNYCRYIQEKNIYYSSEYLIDNIKYRIGVEKTVEYILIKLKGDHVHIMYNILESDDIYIDGEGKYIELTLNNYRPKIGEPSVCYWVKSNNVKKMDKFNNVKDYIIYNIL